MTKKISNWAIFWGYIFALILGRILDWFLKTWGNNSNIVWIMKVWSFWDWWITLIALIVWSGIWIKKKWF